MIKKVIIFTTINTDNKNYLIFYTGDSPPPTPDSSPLPAWNDQIDMAMEFESMREAVRVAKGFNVTPDVYVAEITKL